MIIGKHYQKGVGWIKPTHCRRKHAFSEKNVYLYRGRQYCKRCMALNQAAYRKRKKR